MTNSILGSTKKNLGLDASYTAFDPDIILFINGVFSTLCELGIGPAAGFSIEDDSAEWDDFLGGNAQFNSVKTYVYLRVKLLFDPPNTGFVTQAIKEQIKELEWRLNVIRENEAWVAPGTMTVAPVVPSPGDTDDPSKWWDLTGLSDFPAAAQVGDYGWDRDTGKVYRKTGNDWDLTGLSDFPPEAAVGDYGYDRDTNKVWRKTG